MKKELKEYVSGKLNEIYEARKELDVAYSKYKVLVEDLDSKFKTRIDSYYTPYSRLDVIEKTIEKFKELSNMELDFNFNGDLNYSNGHQCRIIQYGKNYAFEYLYTHNDNYGGYIEIDTHTIDFGTLEEAQKYFLERMILGDIKIVDGFYKYTY
jgi:hypothetical protein